MEFQASLEGPGVQDQFSGLLNILAIHILIQIVEMDGNGLNIILSQNTVGKKVSLKDQVFHATFL